MSVYGVASKQFVTVSRSVVCKLIFSNILTGGYAIDRHVQSFSHVHVSITSQEYHSHHATKEITRKATLECKCDYDENSDTNARTQVRHPRLVMFMGAGRMPDKNLFLVLEYMELGGMDELIESHEKDRALSWTVRSLIFFV